MLNISDIISKFIKNSSQRELERLKEIVKKINAYEPQIKELPDESFSLKTTEFKSKLHICRFSFMSHIFSGSAIFCSFKISSGSKFLLKA